MKAKALNLMGFKVFFFHKFIFIVAFKSYPGILNLSLAVEITFC